MVRRLGLVVCVLFAPCMAYAAPFGDLWLVTDVDLRTAGLTVGEPLGTASSAESHSMPGGWQASTSAAHYRSRDEAGRGIASWLLSASFFSLCLSTGLSDMVHGDPQLVAASLGRSGAIEPLVIPEWASGIARAVGVVAFDCGSVGTYEHRRGHLAAKVSLLLVPVGPENAAGLTISGSFR